MKATHFKSFLGMLWLVCLGLIAHGQTTIAINGQATVCKNNTAAYSISSPTSGVSYQWTMSSPLGNFSTIYGPSTSVLWSTPGTTTITIQGRDNANVLVETGTKSVTVEPLPQPTITTNYKVGCQNFPDDPKEQQPPPKQPLFDDQGCPKVCEGSWVTYTANGFPGSGFVWTVSGGTAYPSGTTCLVHWGAIGMGNVSVKEITTDGCEGTRNICIEIIGKPHARFGAMPDTLAPSVIVCLKDNVIFVDHSYATSSSPIVNWYWDFGDGQTFSSSASTNPTHQYLSSGVYTVMLVVKNACNCTDTAWLDVQVNEGEGVKITCASVVCENARTSYTLENASAISCGSYNWSVIGGTITSPPAYGSSINVTWDNVDDDGFGYVQFDASPCAVDCPGVTTIKIPVIKAKGLIKGITAVCENKQYKYTLPAWPGTTYTWSVSNGLGYLSHTDQPNEIVLHTLSSYGSIILHCDYYNSLVGCGGTGDLKIMILPPDSMVGNTPVCLNSSSIYNLLSGNIGDWTLTAPNGSTSTYTGVNGINPTFTQVGVYSLAVNGNFCSPEPLQITVLDLPPAPNFITGPDTICLNVPYEFTAGNTVPGTVFDWTVVGGSLTSGSSGKTVSVKFTAAIGPYEIHVHRSLTQSPFCPGPDIFKTLYKPVINLAIAGKDTVCPNSVWPYSAGYYGGETYEWSISNPLLGSIDDNKLANIHITWNNQNTTVTAVLTLKVTRCSVTAIQTYNVVILPAPIMSLLANDSVCRDMPLSVSITSSPALTSGTLNWSLLGSAITTPVVIPPGTAGDTYTFHDISTGNVGKDISVVITNPNGCMATVTLTKHITVKPAPIALVTPIGPIVHCGAFTETLTATLQSGAGVTNSLLWSTGANCTAPGFSCNPISTSTYGSYYVTATGTNGCTNQSNIVNIVQNCGNISCNVVPAPIFTVTQSQQCGHVTVKVQYSSTNFSSGPTFNFPAQASNVITGNGVPGSPTNPARIDADFSAAGSYDFSFDFTYLDVNNQPCVKRVYASVVVPVVADLLYNLSCANATGYSIQLLDHSTYYPGVGGLTYTYQVDAGPWVSAGTTYNYGTLSAGTTHTLNMAVGFTYPGYTSPVCTTSRSVVVPALPVASFTVGPVIPACVNQQSIQMTNTSTAATSYSWLFGDGSGTTLANPVKTYGTPGSPTITLTASNAFGCSSTASTSVTIKANPLNGTMSATPATICEGAMATLTYNPSGIPDVPSGYTWMNDINAIYTTTTSPFYVNQTGAYWVHAFNAAGCWVNTKPLQNVTVLHVPDAIITGDSLECTGNDFTLYGYAGSDPSLTYAWTRNGSPVGATPNLPQSGLAPGTYTYKLTITSTIGSTTCSKSSAPFTVVVHAPPAAPTIGFTIPNCNPYTVQLTASPFAPGTYNWSNGTSGNPITAFVGGPYKVWYTDLYGCTVSAEKDVPKDPKGYLWIFPTGCYTACPPVVIPGPIIPFVQWGYYDASGILLSGTNSVPLPFSPTTNGYYGMFLDNGYCSANIDTLDLTLSSDCGGTGGCKGISASVKVGYDKKCYVFPVFTVTNSTGGPMPYTITSTVGYIAPPFNTGTLNPGSNSINTQWVPPGGFGSGVVTFFLTVTLPDGTTCTTKLTENIKCIYGGPVQRLSNSTSGTMDVMLAAAPNPARNTTLISYSYANDAAIDVRTIEVYDMTGRKVATHVAGTAQSGNWILNLDNIAAGAYQIVMKEGASVIATTRLSITR